MEASQIAKVKELNERCAKAKMYCEVVSATNLPTDSQDRLKVMAQVRLAQEAYMRTDMELRDALNGLSAEEIITLANG